jgi:hypothetical protein
MPQTFKILKVTKGDFFDFKLAGFRLCSLAHGDNLSRVTLENVQQSGRQMALSVRTAVIEDKASDGILNVITETFET